MGAIDEVEAMSDEDAMKDVESVLKKMFPGYEPPLSFHVTRWKSDPYSRGAYSFVRSGAAKADYSAMAKPIAGDPVVDDPLRPAKGSDVKTRLYFAGEATSSSD